MVNPVLLIIIPMGTAFAISFLSSFIKGEVRYIALLSLLAEVWAAVSLYPDILDNPVEVVIAGFRAPVGINLVAGPAGVLFAVIISVSALLVFIYSMKYIEKSRQGKYSTLFLLLITGAQGMVLTGDIFNLFVFFEILAISSYILVGFSEDRNGFEASIKYLILGSAGSVLLLVAIALVYQETGTLNLAQIAEKFTLLPSGKRIIITTLFTTGMGVEAAVFPLNTWLPDAHSSAPSSISAVLSGFVIEVALIVIMKFVYSVFAMTSILRLLGAAGVITLLVGEFAAYNQVNIKRALAYSSIGQVGLILFALSLNTEAGVSAGFMQIVNHAASKSVLFLTAGYMIKKTGSYNFADFRALGKEMPVSSFLFSLGALSLLGVPPLFGFFSKLAIITAALNTGDPAFIIMSGSVLLGTVIESVYFVRIIQVLYSRDAVAGKLREAPVLSLVPVAIFSAAIILGFLVLPEISLLTDGAAAELINSFSTAGIF